MRSMEEDEDVIFEGSAIYKHLQDTGYTDFEFTQLRTSCCPEETTKNDSCEDKKNVLECLREKWFCLLSTIMGKWVPEYVAYKEIAEFVAQSKLVNDDDWLVLEHFMPGGEELRNSGFLTGPKASVYKILFFFGISSIILLVLQLLCVASETWCFSFVIIILTLPISLILGQIVVFVRCIIFIHHVKRFVSLLREISQIASKSVQLLLEVDLITKGFVL
ncbi:uncharacterized protein [Panulirus ornatus]|uniref:uncharacterized protein isoform X1 n=1 Tax=Panulirus ornatus TaxID=150431 RepID=UPI003A84F1CB